MMVALTETPFDRQICWMLVNILSWQAVFSCRSISLFLDELNTVEFPCYLLYLPYHKLSSLFKLLLFIFVPGNFTIYGSLSKTV